MIKSFKHKGSESFFYTNNKGWIKPEHANRLARILDRLNAASEIKDLNYPGSFLHQLSGNKKGLYSVNVSDNWSISLNLLMATPILSMMMIIIRRYCNEKIDKTPNASGKYY